MSSTGSIGNAPLPPHLPVFFNIDPSLVIFSFSLFTPDAVQSEAAHLDTVELGKHLWYCEVVASDGANDGSEGDVLPTNKGKKGGAKSELDELISGAPTSTSKPKRVGDVVVRFPTIRTVQEVVVEVPLEEEQTVNTESTTVDLAHARPAESIATPAQDFAIPSEPQILTSYFAGGNDEGDMKRQSFANDPTGPAASAPQVGLESTYYPLASVFTGTMGYPAQHPRVPASDNKPPATAMPPMTEATPTRKTQFKVKRVVRFHDSVVCRLYANGTVLATASRFVDSLYLVAEHIRSYFTSTILSKCPWAVWMTPTAHHALLAPLASKVLQAVPSARFVRLAEYNTNNHTGAEVTLDTVCQALLDPINMTDMMVIGNRSSWLAYEESRAKANIVGLTDDNTIPDADEAVSVESVFPHFPEDRDETFPVDNVVGGNRTAAANEQGPTDKQLHRLRCLLGVSPLYAHLDLVKPPLFTPPPEGSSDDHGGTFSYFLDENGGRNWSVYDELGGLIVEAHHAAAKQRAELRRTQKQLGTKRSRPGGEDNGDGMVASDALLGSTFYGGSVGGSSRRHQKDGLGSVLYGSELGALAGLASCLPSMFMPSQGPDAKFEALSVMVHGGLKGSTTRRGGGQGDGNSLVNFLMGGQDGLNRLNGEGGEASVGALDGGEDKELCPYVSNCLLATEDVESELMNLHGFSIQNFFAHIKPTDEALHARRLLKRQGGLNLSEVQRAAAPTPQAGVAEGDQHHLFYDFGSILHGVANDMADTLAHLEGQMRDAPDASTNSGGRKPSSAAARPKRRMTGKHKGEAEQGLVSDVGMEVGEFQHMLEMLSGRAEVTFGVETETVVAHDHLSGTRAALRTVAQATSSALQGGTGFNSIPASRTSSPANYPRALREHSAATLAGATGDVAAGSGAPRPSTALYALHDRILLKANTLDACRFEYHRQGRVTEVSIRRGTGYIRVLRATDMSDVYILANGILPTVMGLLQGYSLHMLQSSVE